MVFEIQNLKGLAITRRKMLINKEVDQIVTPQFYIIKEVALLKKSNFAKLPILQGRISGRQLFFRPKWTTANRTTSIFSYIFGYFLTGRH